MGSRRGARGDRMPLTHRREPLRTGIVGEVGKVFRKKRCGLQKGVIVAQIERIIWEEKKKKEKLSPEL